MRIGVTMRVVKNDAYPEVRDALSLDWSRYIKKILPEAILIPIVNDPKNAVRTLKELRIDAVILSNGNDWGEVEERDETERNIVNYCVKNCLPILGVCRGFQVLNILFGGKVSKNISKKTDEKHAGAFHAVKVKGKNIKVNSYHNHGIFIENLSPEFCVLAMAKDGLVEAFYHPKKPILAIQWHPERRSPNTRFDRKIIINLFKKK